MGLNIKKILSVMLTAQLLYTSAVIAVHIAIARSISGFWHGELLAHFLHYEMAFLPVLIAFIGYKRFPKITAAFLVVCLLGAVALYKKSRPQVTYEKAVAQFNHDRVIQVICYNGNTSNPKKQDFVNWVKGKFKMDIPTLLVVIEASPDWSNALLALEKQLPNTMSELSEDSFGMYLASNMDLKRMRIEKYTYQDIPSIQGTLTFASKTFSFAAVHPFPPISNHWFQERVSYTKAVKEWFVSQNMPGIACGDFNTTMYTQAYQNFTAPPAPFKDAFWGPLRPLTWGVLGLYTAIDFIFYSPEFDLIYADAGPKNGSDHKPIAALLRWK